MDNFLRRYTSVLVLLALSVTAFAQAPAKTDPAYPAAFDAAYWLAQPPAVRALHSPQGIADENAQTQAAAQLAIQGYTVDTQTVVWGWDPYKVMKQRQDYGYKWVPNFLQAPPSCAPVNQSPQCSGGAAYNPDAPPGGAIRVSTDIADYPPFDPPAPVQSPTAAPANYVGGQNVGTLYFALPGDPTPDGATVATASGKFLKHKVATPFGFSQWYERMQ